ncbi:MAG: stage III sporulation protein AD [Clostridiales bacterium]|jgi:stage III sporulation protein AD|nr:stage III sporulation protein AD [Clostridiales bacterium]
MNVYQVAAIGVIAAVLALTVKKDSPMFSLVISIAASVLIFIILLPNLSTVLDILWDMTESVDTSIPYAASLIKIIGIAYIAELGAQICADAGETAISSKIELAGKVIILTVASPMIFTLMQQVITMLP